MILRSFGSSFTLITSVIFFRPKRSGTRLLSQWWIPFYDTEDPRKTARSAPLPVLSTERTRHRFCLVSDLHLRGWEMLHYGILHVSVISWKRYRQRMCQYSVELGRVKRRALCRIELWRWWSTAPLLKKCWFHWKRCWRMERTVDDLTSQRRHTFYRGTIERTNWSAASEAGKRIQKRHWWIIPYGRTAETASASN